MTARLHRLPLVPLAEPIQLVLGLDGVGIRKPKRRRRAAIAPIPPMDLGRAA